jgi:nucleotide-binding universal stress UspA family protein
MKILLATDGSEYSERTAHFLTRMKWSPDDSITVFHAVYAVPFPHDEKFHYGTLAAIKKDIAPRILDSALAVLKPVQANLSVEIEEFSPGSCTPDQCIVRAAGSSGSDLIVLGARGVKGFASAFLGSVTRLVAINSPVPVLAVKPAARVDPATMKVLFATDGSASSRASGEFLASLPVPDSAEITIVNVVSSGFSDIPERFAVEINDRIKQVVAETREHELAESEKILELARAHLSKRYKNLSALTRVGDPSAEILAAAESMEADMIAVGCRGLRGVKGVLGSVSRNILTHSGCSVLIGKTCGD